MLDAHTISGEAEAFFQAVAWWFCDVRLERDVELTRLLYCIASVLDLSDHSDAQRKPPSTRDECASTQSKYTTVRRQLCVVNMSSFFGADQESPSIQLSKLVCCISPAFLPSLAFESVPCG